MNPFKREIDVEFVKAFTSPVLGNVWVGRKSSLKKDLAEKYINAGVAKLNDGSNTPAKAMAGFVQVVGANKKEKPPELTDAQKKLAKKAAKEKAEADKAAAKAEKEKAEADAARIEELLGQDELSEDDEAELKALEAAAFEEEGQ